MDKHISPRSLCILDCTVHSCTPCCVSASWCPRLTEWATFPKAAQPLPADPHEGASMLRAPPEALCRRSIIFSWERSQPVPSWKPLVQHTWQLTYPRDHLVQYGPLCSTLFSNNPICLSLCWGVCCVPHRVQLQDHILGTPLESSAATPKNPVNKHCLKFR